MAEAVKQFFVGFIHPRTWLAALIGIVVAFLVALVVAAGFSATADMVTNIANQIFGGNTTLAIQYVKGLAAGVFGFMILPYFFLVSASSFTPIIVLVAGGLVGGLLFGLLSKKERVASKSIIGGLNIAVIYLVLVVAALVFWTVGFSGFTAFGTAAYNFVAGIWLDVLISFLIVWWVAAIVSILILSIKSD